MFHEDREIMVKLKKENRHFQKLFEQHNALDDEIKAQMNHLSDVDMEILKKKKLKLKDEMAMMIHNSK